MVNTNEVVTKVKKLLGEELEVKAVSIDKGNGVSLSGITIKREDSNIAPNIYLDPDCDDVDEQASRIVEIYKTCATDSVDVGFFSDYEQVKKKLGIKLSSQPAKDLVKQRAFADIYMTAFVKLDHSELGSGAINIKEEHIKTWGIDVDTLFTDALFYAKLNQPVELKTMGGFLGERGLEFPDEANETLESITILSNRDMVYGASAIMYYKKPKEFYMLPSSVHELLLMPATQVPNEHELTEMVKVVNATEVAPQDVLANHAYHYINGEFKIIE